MKHFTGTYKSVQIMYESVFALHDSDIYIFGYLPFKRCMSCIHHVL